MLSARASQSAFGIIPSLKQQRQNQLRKTAASGGKNIKTPFLEHWQSFVNFLPCSIRRAIIDVSNAEEINLL
jgi:hypothetical protein